MFQVNFSFPQIDFKATRLILSRLLVNNPVNNPFSRFHAMLFVGIMMLQESKERSRGVSLEDYPPPPHTHTGVCTHAYDPPSMT